MNRSTVITLLKVFSLILGIVILGVGYHAYFDSEYNTAWRNDDQDFRALCILAETGLLQCPQTVSFETAALAMTTVLLVATAAFLILQKLLMKNESINGKVDMLYQWITAAAFITSGAFFIYSAYEIRWFFADLLKEHEFPRNVGQRFDEKMVAGYFCIINGAVLATAGFLSALSAKASGGQVFQR